MNDRTPPDPYTPGISLDEFLKDVLPEVKISLGALIDRENARVLPGRYARLLPQTLLVVTLRPDVAAALAPIAVQIEHELTESCTRHGSLYDRIYAVQLRRASAPEAPLFTVAAHAGQPREPSPESPSGPAPERPEPVIHDSDPDATRVDGWDSPGWDAGRWMLMVEDGSGEEREVFRLSEPLTTVGRRSDDPRLQVTVALSEAPHVSRRQLALLWDGDEPIPGFRVFNLGLNSLHLEGREVPGARLGRRALELDEIDASHSARLEIGSPIRIGEHGPRLRIVEVPETEVDPDATVHG
jgi:hypothetical protein